VYLFGAIVALLAGVFVAGIVPRLARKEQLRAEAKQAGEERPLVRIVKPHRAGDRGELALPGSVEAVQDVPINARASGYLRKRLVDIGDAVQANQLLAEIDTPELDHEIAQAEASLNQLHAALDQTKATEVLARATTARYDKLAASSLASVQEAEEKRAGALVAVANIAAAEAAIKSGEANLARLRDLKSFARVTAPFAGTITERNTEIGALINAGQGQPLYRLARTNPVRVRVRVPQADAPSVIVGREARLEVRGMPGRPFKGKVERTARSVEVATRTMLAEVDIANPDGALMPGMYGQVFLPASKDNGSLLVPSVALLVSAQGTQVLTIDGGDRVHVHKVHVEADYGTEIAISEGLEADERVITNPSERLVEGVQVMVTKSPDK
jgi:RND family efflux transporter MFP subunit